MSRFAVLAVPGVALAVLTASSAEAHPHIFVDAKATITFGADGTLASIRNEWTFDEAFSVWQVQGLDTNGDGITSPEEMQGLADENLAALADFGFYTSVGEGGQTIPLQASGPARFAFSDDRSTLTFSVVPKAPYRIQRSLEIGIADPAYYVGITFAGPTTVAVETLPAGCRSELLAGTPMSDDVSRELLSLGPDVLQLPAQLAAKLRGSQQEIVITCGD